MWTRRSARSASLLVTWGAHGSRAAANCCASAAAVASSTCASLWSSSQLAESSRKRLQRSLTVASTVGGGARGEVQALLRQAAQQHAWQQVKELGDLSGVVLVEGQCEIHAIPEERRGGLAGEVVQSHAAARRPEVVARVECAQPANASVPVGRPARGLGRRRTGVGRHQAGGRVGPGVDGLMGSLVEGAAPGARVSARRASHGPEALVALVVSAHRFLLGWGEPADRMVAPGRGQGQTCF